MTKLVRSALLFLVALVAVVPAGCGPSGASVSVQVPEKWADELISWIVQWLEQRTGTEIEKGDVKIESLGARSASSGHVSDYRITVKFRKTEFTTTAKDVPCSADAIPTKEGNAHVKESVKEIREQIKAAR